MKKQDEQYNAYLLKRSALGKIYRNWVLYPVLNRFLNGRVLDIGCGIGDMLHYRKGTIGVDINSFNVEFCESRGLNARLMDLDVLPFPSENFDSILLDNVLEHIDDPSKLLVEIGRVLKPGGKLLLGVPGIKGQASDPDHKKFYDENALLLLAGSHRFLVERFFYMPIMKSDWLSEHLKQYCLYSIWVKPSDSSF